MRRIIGIAALAFGLILLTAAGVVRWAVAPQLSQLPGDTNATRLYTGTATVLANPTLTSGSLVGPALMRNVPIQVQHSDQVVATKGQAALVSDIRRISVNGMTVADLHYRLGVDRKSLQARSGFASVVSHRGLAFNWPLGVGQHDYTGWVPDTGGTTLLRYSGTATHGGVLTDVFKASTPDRPITDPQVLKLLPSAISKADLMTMVPSMGLTQKQLIQMSKTLAGLPDPVPMAYTYRMTGTYWVAPASGIVVDIVQSEVRSASFVDGATTIPVTPVMAMTYTSTPQTLTGAVADARSAANKLHLINTVLPEVLLVGGVVLTVVGLALLVLAGRRPTEEAPVFPPEFEESELTQLLAHR